MKSPSRPEEEISKVKGRMILAGPPSELRRLITKSPGSSSAFWLILSPLSSLYSEPRDKMAVHGKDVVKKNVPSEKKHFPLS